MARLELKQLKRIQTYAVTFFIVGWFSSWGVNAFYETKFIGYPRTPRPEIGMIVPYPIKGVVAFVPQVEARRATIARHISLSVWWTFILVGLPLGVHVKRQQGEHERLVIEKSLLELKRSK